MCIYRAGIRCKNWLKWQENAYTVLALDEGGIIVTRSEKAAARERRKRMAEGAASLAALLDARSAAYAAFNRSTDPALLESAILEIGALNARCGALLRLLKAAEHDIQGGPVPRASSDPDPARRRRRPSGAAAEAAEKAHQMDP
jgi:hypothetical protein